MGGLCAVSRALRGGPLSRAARSLFAALILAFAAPAFAQFPGPINSGVGSLKAVPVSGGFPASAWGTATINAPTSAVVNGSVAGLATLQTARTAVSLPVAYTLSTTTTAVTRTALAVARRTLPGTLATYAIGRMLEEARIRFNPETQTWEKQREGAESSSCWYSGQDTGACYETPLLACKAHPKAGNFETVLVEQNLPDSASCVGTYQLYGQTNRETFAAAAKVTGTPTTTTKWEVVDEPTVQTELEPIVKARAPELLRDLAQRVPNEVIPDTKPTLRTPATSRTGTALDGTPQSVIITNQPDGSITGQDSPSPIPDSNNGDIPGDPNKPREEALTPAVDPAMPPIPKLYERKYPDGLVGVWNAKQAAWKETQFYQAIAALTPNLGDGGCPKWTLPLNFGKGLDYGERDFSIPCPIWEALRILLLVYALFVARGLIFGG